MTTTINGLTYNFSTRIGECGVNKRNNDMLYFPFFLLGTCGDDRGVISRNGVRGVREYIVAPNKMNYDWFAIIAKRLKENHHFDWDWDSFQRNILEPNREHIKEELGISDEKMDTFMRDGNVFINNFNNTWEDLDGRVEGKDIGYYPNFKNFLEHDRLEY